jgi:hypothetical protein
VIEDAKEEKIVTIEIMEEEKQETPKKKQQTDRPRLKKKVSVLQLTTGRGSAYSTRYLSFFFLSLFLFSFVFLSLFPSLPPSSYLFRRGAHDNFYIKLGKGDFDLGIERGEVQEMKGVVVDCADYQVTVIPFIMALAKALHSCGGTWLALFTFLCFVFLTFFGVWCSSGTQNGTHVDTHLQLFRN